MYSLQIRNRFPDFYQDKSSVKHEHSGTVEHQDTRSPRELARAMLHMLHKDKAQRAEQAKLLEHQKKETDG